MSGFSGDRARQMRNIQHAASLLHPTSPSTASSPTVQKTLSWSKRSSTTTTATFAHAAPSTSARGYSSASSAKPFADVSANITRENNKIASLYGSAAHFDDAFDDVPASETAVWRGTSATTNANPPHVELHPEDFDSDPFDDTLDVEQIVTLPPPVHPGRTTTTSTHKPTASTAASTVASATASTAASAAASTTAPTTITLDDLNEDQLAALQSSQEIPWSSSPLDHRGPPLQARSQAQAHTSMSMSMSMSANTNTTVSTTTTPASTNSGVSVATKRGLDAVAEGVAKKRARLPFENTSVKPIVIDDEPARSSAHRPNTSAAGSLEAHHANPKPAPTAAQSRQKLQQQQQQQHQQQPQRKVSGNGSASGHAESQRSLSRTPSATVDYAAMFQDVDSRKKQLRANGRDKKGTPDPASATITAHPDEKTDPPKGVESVFLSQEQRHVLDLVVNRGQSVFFTGPAGTGKSVLMRNIITALKKKWSNDPEKLQVTASTGLAACNVGGITLHSFAGIGLGKEDAATLVRKIRRNPKAKDRWRKVKCLVVDEISMVDGDLFDKLGQIGRTLKNNGRPWGGIQLVITGDFFQLPPVPDVQSKRAAKFAFDAETWSTSIDHTIGLTHVFRQKDPRFAGMLNEMRLGRVSDETVRAFRALSRPLRFDDGVECTELFPTRSEVDASNMRRLNELPGQIFRFDAVDTGEEAVREKVLSYMMCPRSLDLKVGAQVMLIKNLDAQLINGSVGKILRFASEEEWEGSGGERLDESVLVKPQQQKKKPNGAPPTPLQVPVFPVVEFLCPEGATRTILVTPDEWKIELPNGEVQAKRSQVPLILAWALSIHKAQGQTLDRMKVDLGKVFEKGQAYVALSRATNQSGLQVLRFDKHKVMAHPRVVEFYNKLYSADSAVRAAKPKTLKEMLAA